MSTDNQRKRKRDTEHNYDRRSQRSSFKSPANGSIQSKETQHSSPTSRHNGNSSKGYRSKYLKSGQSINSTLKSKAQRLWEQRKNLPIWRHEQIIRQSLREENVLLLVGETGSGKSTQVPQMLVNEPWCTAQTVSVPSPGGNEEKRIKVGGCIAITEPRRVAAVSLARRVAEEVGTPLGSSSPASTVGYNVRFDNSTSPCTKIKFLTEGMLLQETLRDPWLRAYSAVIVDEVHERGVNVDLVLGFLKGMVNGKGEGRGGIPLKVAVMSATVDMEGLVGFFEGGDGSSETDGQAVLNGHKETENDEEVWAGLSESDDDEASKNTGERRDQTAVAGKGGTKGRTSVNGWKEGLNVTTASSNGMVSDDVPRIATCHIEGRQYPVQIIYSPEPVPDFVDASLRTIFQIHYKEPLPGDILVFLTGQTTVESLEQLVSEYAMSMSPEVPKLLVLPLFAALPQAVQQRVFQPAPPKTRKVILATNIAETSVTVSGVRYVIDCGKSKIKQFRTKIGLDSLLVKPISKSAAIQRKGRAGREAPGRCYRLYTEQDYSNLQPQNTPEILRCDLGQAVLTMKARGVNDVMRFSFLDQPPREAMEKALMQLFQLQALDDSGAISPIGLEMAKLPLSVPLARVLLAAADADSNCVSEVIDIISSLSVENIFLALNSEEKREQAQAARQELYRREGDHLTLLTTDVRKQLRSQCQQLKMLDPSNAESTTQSISSEIGTSILKCFLKGFATSTARLMPDGTYKTVVDTLDTRFTNSSTSPLTLSDSAKPTRIDPAKAVSGLDIQDGDESRSRRIQSNRREEAQPSKWATPEYILYYIVIGAADPSVLDFRLVKSIDSLAASHPNYPKYEHLLSPGWIPGRKVDNSDQQYSGFRDNIPYTFLLLVFHPLLRRLYNTFHPIDHQSTLSSRKAPPSPHQGHADARLNQRVQFDVAFAFLYLIALHGTSALKILVILYINFNLAKSLPKKYVPTATWIFNIGILFANEFGKGYPYAGIAQFISPWSAPSDPSGDKSSINSWGTYLDSFSGLLPRWEILFNICVLRLISFNMDYYWSLDKKGASLIEKKQLDPSNLSERDRVSLSANNEDYTFRNYFAYVLYSPLYLAGPILTFNDYISQVRHTPRSISLDRTVLYGVRFVISLLTMEVMLHFIYAVAISKSQPAWEIYTPFQLSMLGYFNLHIIWLKLLLPWRFFRLWALLDGIDPPENMVRCMSDNYSTTAFWRGWHRSYNRWIVRYIYIPLGGSGGPGTHGRFGQVRAVFNMLAVFTFVAMWHDIQLKLLIWSWLVVLFVLPEVLAGYLFPAKRWQNHKDAYRYLCGIGAVGNILMMMAANLVGFALGLDGLKGLVRGIVGSYSGQYLSNIADERNLCLTIILGLVFLATACTCLFVGAQVMFELREHELRYGIKLKC
ncbi:MAG: hypothetical protein Q9222_004532 [Ikaeria aurantiellina]